MDAQHHNEIHRAVAVLKDLLHAQGLSYASVAAAMEVSERTVQRWMAGDQLTLQLLGGLCGLLGVSIAELFELARAAVDERPRRLTIHQEEALVATPMLAFLFTRLLQGWTAPALQAACGFGEAELVGYLVAFDRLELIELHPGNRIRLLTRRDIEWRKGGPMRRYFDSFARRLMAAVEFGAPNSIWTSEAFHLTDTAGALIDRKLQSLRLEVRQLAAEQREIPVDEKHWYSLLLLAHRHDLEDREDPLGSTFLAAAASS